MYDIGCGWEWWISPHVMATFFKPNFAREYGRFSLATVHVHVNPSLPIEQEPPIGLHCPKRHVAKPYATRPSVTPTVFYLYIERRNKSITVNTTFFSAIWKFTMHSNSFCLGAIFMIKMQLELQNPKLSRSCRRHFRFRFPCRKPRYFPPQIGKLEAGDWCVTPFLVDATWW